jgi:hypothetical protein
MPPYETSTVMRKLTEPEAGAVQRNTASLFVVEELCVRLGVPAPVQHHGP